jgi:hypothetical protein
MFLKPTPIERIMRVIAWLWNQDRVSIRSKLETFNEAFVLDERDIDNIAVYFANLIKVGFLAGRCLGAYSSFFCVRHDGRCCSGFRSVRVLRNGSWNENNRQKRESIPLKFYLAARHVGAPSCYTSRKLRTSSKELSPPSAASLLSWAFVKPDSPRFDNSCKPRFFFK